MLLRLSSSRRTLSSSTAVRRFAGTAPTAAAAAPTTTAPSHRTPALMRDEAHWEAWGRAIMAQNVAQVACTTSPADCSATDEAWAAHHAASYCVTREAQAQLAALVSAALPGSHVYLCGACVSIGVLGADADWDFMLVPPPPPPPQPTPAVTDDGGGGSGSRVSAAGGSSATPDGAAASGPFVPRARQLQLSTALHKALQRHVPDYMRRSFVNISTARTPIVACTYTYQPAARRVGAADAADPAVAPGVATAARDANTPDAGVCDAVRATRARVLTQDEDAASRTVYIHLRGVDVSADDAAAAIAAARTHAREAAVARGAEATDKDADDNDWCIEVVERAYPVADRFQHPMGYTAPVSAAEEHSLALQAAAAKQAATATSTLLTLRGKTPLAALHALGVFPDGRFVKRARRDDVTRDVFDRRFVPALLRRPWDVSFAGHAAPNSYLLRHYVVPDAPTAPTAAAAAAGAAAAAAAPSSMLMTAAPEWMRHVLLALKRWGACSRVSRAAEGYLTSYALAVMLSYYALVTRQAQWIDPARVPSCARLPAVPPAAPPLQRSDAASRAAAAEVGWRLADFFRFYAQHVSHGDEVVSLNRARRSTRRDVGWGSAQRAATLPAAATTKQAATHAHEAALLCVEDPYEEVGGSGGSGGGGGLNLGRHLTEDKYATVNAEFDAALRAMVLQRPPATMVVAGQGHQQQQPRDACGVAGATRADDVEVVLGVARRPADAADAEG